MVNNSSSLNLVMVVLVWALVVLFAVTGQALTGVLVGHGFLLLLLLIQEPVFGVPLSLLSAWTGWLVWTGGVG